MGVRFPRFNGQSLSLFLSNFSLQLIDYFLVLLHSAVFLGDEHLSLSPQISKLTRQSLIKPPVGFGLFCGPKHSLLRVFNSFFIIPGLAEQFTFVFFHKPLKVLLSHCLSFLDQAQELLLFQSNLLSFKLDCFELLAVLPCEVRELVLALLKH